MANESDVKSCYTNISSASTAPQFPRMRFKNTPLHERCSMTDMVKLKQEFQDAYRQKLLPSDFRNILRNILNLEYDDDEFKLLFLKVSM